MTVRRRAWKSSCVVSAGPARPSKPELVNPLAMPKAKTSGVPQPAFMLHQLAHVELNAIDLAWDTVARFSHLGLPRVCCPHQFLI
jgi:uncharacterized ferritin-like protein (DUF455 family)